MRVYNARHACRAKCREQCFHFLGNFLILGKFDLHKEIFKETDFPRKFLRIFKPLPLCFDDNMICFWGCDNQRIVFLDGRCQGEDNAALKWDPQSTLYFVGQSILALQAKEGVVLREVL